jgi:hypothetical protein
MKSLNTKLVLSALGVALLATPALADQVRPVTGQTIYNPKYPNRYASQYPNPQIRSGSAESVESGAEFNLGH